MKWKIIQWMLMTVWIVSFSPLVKAADTYTFNSKLSYVQWYVNYLGFTNQSGKWFIKGNLILDEASPQNSKVEATINLMDIDTGNKDLDVLLITDTFFNIANYPIATFKSDKVVLLSDTTAKVSGSLMLHGVARPVTLDVKLNKIGKNIATGKQAVGFSAKTMLSRTDFAMVSLLPNVGDAVSVVIEVEAYLAR